MDLEERTEEKRRKRVSSSGSELSNGDIADSVSKLSDSTSVGGSAAFSTLALSEIVSGAPVVKKNKKNASSSSSSSVSSFTNQARKVTPKAQAQAHKQVEVSDKYASSSCLYFI